MSVSVSMPQLGESVTEGTVTRWLKREGERVQADEPLLEVSTDKVDTEIPSPVSGVLRGITVAEDETVAVGAELAVIDEEGAEGGEGGEPAGGAAPAQTAPAPGAASANGAPGDDRPEAAEAEPDTAQGQPAQVPAAQAQAPAQDQPGYNASPYQQPYQPQPGYGTQAPSYQPTQPPAQQAPAQQAPAPPQEPGQPGAGQQEPQAPAAVYQTTAQPPGGQPQAQAPAAEPEAGQAEAGQAEADGAQQADGFGPQLGSGADGPYVTPLVRKLATEHGIDLGTVSGTGVGGRIRKQDVLDASRVKRDAQGAPQAANAQPPAQAPTQAPAQAAPPQEAAPAAAPAPPAPAPPAPVSRPAGAPGAASRPAIEPSSLRGRTEKLSRSRQVIAQRMVESLQTSAQLTTVVEADVTEIARLRDRAKADFEAREGVKLSFLPFFALATVEALKVHPRLNAVIDTAGGQVTYHDAEHLGIAVDTERGLMVPVIRKAGDLNIAGLARKIADLAQRTRAGQVSPDELSGGTFTLTNTGSRGALFDTPIINQPQVGILGTGTVVKRAVVVDDPALGEVITVRSMVYLALTYDHRLVDGADAARFLGTVKARLQEGAFETELGL
ncbi:MAG TPA: 2-oxo acid dehydrogenase subunit E2 [Streptosporangiaceae bacterium]|nr:2-oxo acid dehydrogenase subunit E2 [Streptosporangiaceae bacterium]